MIDLSEYSWHDAKQELPESGKSVIFVAQEFGYSPTPFLGYCFNGNWRVASIYYGVDHPDAMTLEDILCWSYIPYHERKR